MIRTQIQLTEKQSAKLKKLAKERNLSIADLIRQGVDLYLKTHSGMNEEDRQKRALSIVGAFRASPVSLSEDHDKALLTADRRHLSIVDCTSFEIMRKQGIEKVFCFDKHFKEQGFDPI